MEVVAKTAPSKKTIAWRLYRVLIRELTEEDPLSFNRQKERLAVTLCYLAREE